MSCGAKVHVIGWTDKRLLDGGFVSIEEAIWAIEDLCAEARTEKRDVFVALHRVKNFHQEEEHGI